jgi:hypothetical protein
MALPAVTPLKLVDVVDFPAGILRFFFGLARVAQTGRKVRTSVAMSLSQLPKRIPIALLGHADRLGIC